MPALLVPFFLAGSNTEGAFQRIRRVSESTPPARPVPGSTGLGIGRQNVPRARDRNVEGAIVQLGRPVITAAISLFITVRQNSADARRRARKFSRSGAAKHRCPAIFQRATLGAALTEASVAWLQWTSRSAHRRVHSPPACRRKIALRRRRARRTPGLIPGSQRPSALSACRDPSAQAGSTWKRAFSVRRPSRLTLVRRAEGGGARVHVLPRPAAEPRSFPAT